MAESLGSFPSMKRLLLSSFFGGLVVFLWSNVSWLLLGWHAAGMRTFTNERAVGEILAANAPQPGLYLLPSNPADAGAEITLRQQIDRKRAGPFFFGSVRAGRHHWTLPGTMAKSFVTQLAAAFLLTCVLGAARFESYGGRVTVCAVAGLFAGLVGHVPNATWWEFPVSSTIVQIADLTLSWLLAGLVMARFTSPGRSHSATWAR